MEDVDVDEEVLDMSMAMDVVAEAIADVIEAAIADAEEIIEDAILVALVDADRPMSIFIFKWKQNNADGKKGLVDSLYFNVSKLDSNREHLSMPKTDKRHDCLQEGGATRF